MQDDIIMGKIYKAYIILEKMHKQVEKLEPFPEDLKNEALNIANELAPLKPEDPEINEYITGLVKTIYSQLELSDEIQEKKDNLWKEHVLKHSKTIPQE